MNVEKLKTVEVVKEHFAVCAHRDHTYSAEDLAPSPWAPPLCPLKYKGLNQHFRNVECGGTPAKDTAN